MRGRFSIGDFIIALAVIVLLAWVLWLFIPAPRVEAPAGPAGDQLRTLIVRSDEGTPDYNRDQFGQKWADEDHNGCDTRNDILARDLARPTFKPNTRDCVVLSGTLAEPYTGKVIEFQRGQDTS
ncbi:MAG: HNH endonuclease, partial [Actinomyces sp.]|nr:HNH endonuclease [Actinomyces sp.]